MLISRCITREVCGQEVLTVPRGNGTPVIIDGKFRAGEWRDASAIGIGPSVRLYLKQYKGNVFIGLKIDPRFAAYVDLFLGLENGELFNLHASMQIGERLLTGKSWSDTEPPIAWGNEREWTANRSNFDPHKDPARPVRERLLPYDGKEFRLGRARFKGRQWRLRVEVRDLEGKRSTIVFPSNSQRFNQTDWAVLKLE